MRKIVILILIFLYSTSVSGAAFHLHFCGTYLQSVSFAGEEHEGCCCGKNEMKTNCCEDKVVVFKSDLVHKQAELNAEISYSAQFSTAFYEEVLNVQNTSYYLSFIPRDHSPPPVRQNGNSILVRNCVFRI